MNKRTDYDFARAVAASQLSGLHKGLLQYVRIWFQADGTCLLRESFETLAANTGWKERAVKTAVKELEAAGWLVRTGNQYFNGKGRPTIEYSVQIGEPGIPVRQSASNTELSASHADQSASNDKQSAPDAHNSINTLNQSKEESTGASAPSRASAGHTPSISQRVNASSIGQKNMTSSIGLTEGVPQSAPDALSPEEEDPLDWDSIQLPSQRARVARRQGDDW